MVSSILPKIQCLNLTLFYLFGLLWQWKHESASACLGLVDNPEGAAAKDPLRVVGEWCLKRVAVVDLPPANQTWLRISPKKMRFLMKNSSIDRWCSSAIFEYKRVNSSIRLNGGNHNSVQGHLDQPPSIGKIDGANWFNTKIGDQLPMLWQD